MDNKKTIILFVLAVLLAAAVLAVIFGRGSVAADLSGTTPQGAQNTFATSVNTTATAADMTINVSDSEGTIQGIIGVDEAKPSRDDGEGNAASEDTQNTAPVKRPEPAEPTEPVKTTPPAEATDPAQSTTSAQTTKPEVSTQPSGSDPEPLTYEAYLALSVDEQEAYFDSFSDPREYTQWLKGAKKAWEEKQQSILVTGPVDMEQIAKEDP